MWQTLQHCSRDLEVPAYSAGAGSPVRPGRALCWTFISCAQDWATSKPQTLCFALAKSAYDFQPRLRGSTLAAEGKIQGVYRFVFRIIFLDKRLTSWGSQCRSVVWIDPLGCELQLSKANESHIAFYSGFQSPVRYWCVVCLKFTKRINFQYSGYI